MRQPHCSAIVPYARMRLPFTSIDSIHDGQMPTRAGFADVGHEEAMRRAEALVPFLREQAPKNEAARRLTPEVVEALQYERDAPLSAAQGVGRDGASFCLLLRHPGDTFTGRHQRRLGGREPGLSPSQHGVVRRESTRGSLGTEPRCGHRVRHRVPAGARGAGRRRHHALRRMEFLFRRQDHSDWSLLACIVREGEKPTDYVLCLLHRTQYEVIDDWCTLGMRATSSKTVRCKDVFVPRHRVLSMYVAKPGGYSWPGLALHRILHYRIPTSAIGGHCIGACLVGNARNALETTIALVKSRSTNYTGAKMRDFQTVQLRIATAGAKIDAAGLVLRNDCLEAQRISEDGASLPRRRACATSATVRWRCDYASKQWTRSRDGRRERHLRPCPLQRMFRDPRAAAGHFSFSTDAQMPGWALVALGGEFESPTM